MQPFYASGRSQAVALYRLGGLIISGKLRHIVRNDVVLFLCVFAGLLK